LPDRLQSRGSLATFDSGDRIDGNARPFTKLRLRKPALPSELANPPLNNGYEATWISPHFEPIWRGTQIW
jgi:hypothetical protein